MVTVVKHEWHQSDVQYTTELNEEILSEIYPDMDENEIIELLQKIADGEVDIEEIVDDASNSDIEIEWEHQYDDMWTMRKGGYEVSYELGDESSYYTAPEDRPPTHKCTKCRWTGSKWEAGTQYHREDGSVIENYFESDEESDHTTDICPMCDSAVTFTEYGVEQDEKSKKLLEEFENFDE